MDAKGDLTKVRMKPSVVGKPSEPTLKTKGAETWTVCLFLADCLVKAYARMGSEGLRWRDATTALVDLILEIKSHGNVMPTAAILKCLGLYKRYLHLTAADEDLMQPKRHIMLHLLVGISWFGNPNCYSTWLSESLNKLLKKTCRHASQVTFEPSVVLRMADLLRPQHERASLKRALGR